MKVISALTFLPLNKERVENYIKKAKEDILSGNYNPLKIKGHIKAMMTVLTALEKDKDIRKAALNEAEKYNKKSFEEYGLKFSIAEARVEYDYSVCNHDEYNQIVKEIKDLTERKKEIESMLRAHKTKWVVEETGEETYPPAKKSETIVKVTL